MKSTKSIGLAFAALLLASSASAQTIITNILKREVWLGWTRTQVTTNINTNTGANIIVSTNISFPGVWDITDDSPNYGARYGGLIIPTNTALYDFYIASDDSADLYLSSNFSPTNKFMIAQENGWSPLRSWTTIGGGGSIASQKSSLTWTNGVGAMPYSGGILLTAGTRYYLEAIHEQIVGGGRMAVTMVPHNAGAPDGSDTTLTNLGGPGIAIIAVQIPTPISAVFTFSANPTNKTVYPGMTAYFRAVAGHNSQIPPSFQWQRGTVSGGVTNYADIPSATNTVVISASSSSSTYSFVASTNDDTARFRCIAKLPGLGAPVFIRTSTVPVLTVPAVGGLSVSGRVKRELFNPIAGVPIDTITNGNNNFPTSVNTFTSFDVPFAGNGYGERVNGFFTPTATDNYVFFFSADDNAILFVSTNDQPANKVIVAQEDGWSDARDWYGATSTGGSIASQKRSDQWSPDGGTTTPYAAGIPMVSGRRYYIEAVHNGAAANNHVEVTFATTTEVGLGTPANFDPSRLTNNVISYVTTPVTTFAITNQPASVTRDEGLPYTFVVGVRTDSEITPAYQWKKNAGNINGAVASSYTGIALTGDNGALFACDISIPAVTNATSSNAILTVIQGVFAEGILKREFWTNATARNITRQLIGANVGGTFPDADYVLYTPTLDITESRDNNYIQRLSGFFIPPVTTNYIFFLACDDDSDMYISTDQQPANKYMIAQEQGWSNARQWTTANAGSAAQKRSDQFNGGVYAAGIPLTGGQRYYLEIVHHEIGGGEAVSATFKYVGEPDPIDTTTLSRFGGTNIGVPVPPATTLSITANPQNVTTVGWQPVYFGVTAASDGIIAPTYQWLRNSGGGFTNVPGAISAFYGLITSSNDSAAQFKCLVFAPGVPSLTKTSTVASLTVNLGGTFVAGSLDQETWNIGVSSGLIEAGGLGPANTLNTVTNIDFGQLGDNFANRIRGFFIPQVTTNYVFFICSDNNSDLFLSTNDQPSSKLLIAQEQGYANPADSWNSAQSGNPALKNSRTWSPDGGATTPYASGIPLTAGQRYYIEIVHSETGGLDNLGVTFKMFDDADPADGTPSIINSSVLGHISAPTASPPVLTATQNGGILTVSWTPAGGTLLSTPSLAPPITWNTVGTLNPTNLVIGPGNLFLRVSVP